MFFGPEAKWHNVAIVHKFELFYLLDPELSYPDWSLEMFPGQHQLLRIIIMQRKAWSLLQHQPLSLKEKLNIYIYPLSVRHFGAHWHGFLLLQNKTRIPFSKCLVWLVLLAQVCCLSWNTMLMVIANLCQLVMMPSSIVLSFLSMLLLHRNTQRMYLHFSIIWNPGIYPKVTKCSCSTSLGIQILKLMYCYGKLCVSSQRAEEQWRMVILCHLCCFFQTSLTPCYDSFCYWVGEGKIKNPSFFFPSFLKIQHL